MDGSQALSNVHLLELRPCGTGRPADQTSAGWVENLAWGQAFSPEGGSERRNSEQVLGQANDSEEVEADMLCYVYFYLIWTPQ